MNKLRSGYVYTHKKINVKIKGWVATKLTPMLTLILCLTIQPGFSRDAQDEMKDIAVRETRQVISVTGTVTDEAGDPMPGVNIVVKGTSTGVITGIDGEYSISVPNSDAVLAFSFMGYITQEVTVGDRRDINIILNEDLREIEEVVVVGYGTQKKGTLTGSVDVVSGAQLQDRSTANVADLIKGASPNLNISMGGYGGEPGASSSWNIRGVGSINASASPLILVDGIEVDINSIDAGSIESISVLKDASASAIYGSRAPFGVILITTKKGEKGRPRIEYSNNFSINIPQFVSQVNSLTWATAYNQASANAGAAATYSDEQMERIKGYLDGTFPYEYDPDNPIDGLFVGRRNGNANYDWPQELISNSFNQKHNISVSGGGERVNYYFSGGLFDQDGIYRYGYDNFKRYNLLSNLNSQITDWLNVRTGFKYAKRLSDFPVGQTTVERRHIFGEMLTFAPMMPKYNINGTIQSPLIRWQEDSGRDKTEVNDFFASLGVDLEPIKGWVTSFSYNHNVINNRRFVNPKPVWVELGTGALANMGKPNAGWEPSYNQANYSLLNVVTSYEATWGGHYLKALMGYEQEERKYTSIAATGTGLITEEVPSLKTITGSTTVTDDMYHWATQGVFGRLNYNYKEKYLFEFSARYNGSSRFSPDTRWGFFPSASVAYFISKENFWTPVQNIVNSLKIRGSYGSLGNQNLKDDRNRDIYYSYLESMGITSELLWIIDGTRPRALTPPGLISDDLTWETITTLNIGLDAGFLNNRLQLTFDWFERITKDMVGEVVKLPQHLGVEGPKRNNAELSNRGFELVLSWRDRISDDFSYNAKIGLGDNKVKILKYYQANDGQIIDKWYSGKMHGEIWGYETDGIIQNAGETMPDQSHIYARWNPGDIKYKDLNGDGKIDPGTRELDNHGDLKRIGNSTPRYNYSLSAGFNWKGFDFNMFWQGVGKRDYYPGTDAGTGSNDFVFWGIMTAFGSSTILKDTEMLNYWRPADETNLLGPNTDAYFAKPYFSAETNKNRHRQTKYLLSAAYLRLKNVQIGYTLPAHISEKVFIQRARIYLSAENLITFTKLPGSMDPETYFASITSNVGYQTGRIYPLSKTLSIGINLTF